MVGWLWAGQRTAAEPQGHVNRIKMLKRQMFGRASFVLMWKKVLMAS
ncbi:hypothetical protein ACIQU4_09570 [Streptomyces sp. NPDC090741]